MVVMMLMRKDVLAPVMVGILHAIDKAGDGDHRRGRGRC